GRRHRWIGEVIQVEDVEDLRTELAHHPFRYRSALDQREVNRMEDRSGEGIAPQVAVGKGCGCAECGTRRLQITVGTTCRTIRLRLGTAYIRTYTVPVRT